MFFNFLQLGKCFSLTNQVNNGTFLACRFFLTRLNCLVVLLRRDGIFCPTDDLFFAYEEYILASREVDNLFADILERAKIIDPVNTRKWFERLTTGYFDGGSLGVRCPDEATASFCVITAETVLPMPPNK